MTTPSTSLIPADDPPREVLLNSCGSELRLFLDSSGEEMCWVGTPRLPHHSVSKYPIRFYADGHIAGTGAIKFIASRGHQETPTFTQRVRVRDALKLHFISSAVQTLGGSRADNGRVDSYLKEGTGFGLEKERMSEEDVLDYALAGRPERFLRLAKVNGYRFIINVAGLVHEVVSRHYAEVVDGLWDDESTEAADTSNLYANKVLLMKRHGKKLQLVKNHRRPA